MPRRLEEGEWLTRLAPAGILTFWITFRRFVCEEIRRPRTSEKERTEANGGCKAISHWFDIGNGKRILAKIGTLTGDNEVQQGTATTVSARARLDVAEHIGHGYEVCVIEVMGVTGSNHKLSSSLL